MFCSQYELFMSAEQVDIILPASGRIIAKRSSSSSSLFKRGSSSSSLFNKFRRTSSQAGGMGMSDTSNHSVQSKASVDEVKVVSPIASSSKNKNNNDDDVDSADTDNDKYSSNNKEKNDHYSSDNDKDNDNDKDKKSKEIEKDNKYQDSSPPSPSPPQSKKNKKKEHEYAYLYDLIDTTSDGKLSTTEFVRALKNNPSVAEVCVCVQKCGDEWWVYICICVLACILVMAATAAVLFWAELLVMFYTVLYWTLLRSQFHLPFVFSNINTLK